MPIFVADEIVTAAKMNELPKGVIGYAEVTASQTGIGTSPTDLTGLSATVDVSSAARRIRITGSGVILQNTSTQPVIGTINEGSTVLQRFVRDTIPAASRVAVERSVIITPTSGSHTYKLVLNTSGNTCDFEANALFPAFILVEDLGAV